MKQYHRMEIIIISLLLAASVLFGQGKSAEEKADKIYQGGQIILQVDGLSCPFCAYGLEKKLKSLKGVATLDIKINQGLIFLTLKGNSSLRYSQIRKKVNEAGFTLKEIRPAAKD